MPMIDIFLPDNALPPDADRKLGEGLTLVLLRAEGVPNPAPFHLQNTAAFLHRLPASAVQTAAESNAAAVRIQVVTPPNALKREGQKQFTKEATDLVQSLANEGTELRVWVILTEAAEGGWGIAGTAFGIAEFTALAERAAKGSSR